MQDFSDPVRQRAIALQDLQDELDRAEKRLRETKEQLRVLKRTEELVDAEVDDLRNQIDRAKREDERLRIMHEVEDREEPKPAAEV